MKLWQNPEEDYHCGPRKISLTKKIALKNKYIAFPRYEHYKNVLNSVKEK